MSAIAVGSLCRRELIRRAAAAGLLAMSGRAATAQTDQNARAMDFIRQAGNDLTALANAAAASDAERPRLQAFLDRVVDVNGVGRFCLGRFWATASDGQQRTYLALFHRVLLRNVVAWVGTHHQSAAHVTIGRPVAAGQDIDVPTVVARGGDPPAHVTWVVTMNLGEPKIIDVVVEGISMRVTVRNDYASFIQHNNGDIEALIRGLERQADAG
jgi:phospholipid transport system substrate-binding protein